ncbi:unnamed protein product [Sympodiomycopsis kandeliae]
MSHTSPSDPSIQLQQQQQQRQQKQIGSENLQQQSRHSMTAEEASSATQSSYPSPQSPNIGPSSPHGISNISSLNMSPELSRSVDQAHASISDDHSLDAAGSMAPEAALALEAQTLIQMLSLVGSRIWEADQLGLEPALSDTGGQDLPDDDEDSLASSGELGSAARTSDSPIPAPRPLFGVQTQIRDEQAIPQGGRTPLASSVYQLSKARPSFNLSSSVPHRRSPPVGRDTLSGLSKETTRDSANDSDDSSSSSSSSSSGQGQDRTAYNANLQASIAHMLPTSHLSQESIPPVEPIDSDALSQRVQSIFGLPESETIQSSYSCWLFRSVLLQGNLFLTPNNVLFYAYLPSREGKVVKAGAIRKRTKNTYRFSRHWAILRGRALSWYDSQLDPFFPQDHIDLRDIVSVIPSAKHSRHFKVQTSYRTFIFRVESEESRNDWIQTLRKTTFRAQNEGESVRVSIPLEAIVDVEHSQATTNHADTVVLQVVDTEADDFALDEYYFLHFAGCEKFIAALRERIQQQMQTQEGSFGKFRSSAAMKRSSVGSIRDSTGSIRGSLGEMSLGQEVPQVFAVDPRKEPERPQAEPVQRQSGPSSAIAINNNKASRNSFDGPRDTENSPDIAFSVTPRARPSVLESIRAAGGFSGYPPPPSPNPPSSFDSDRSGRIVPHWVKDVPTRLLNGSPTLHSLLRRRKGIIRPIREIWSNPMQIGVAAGQGISSYSDSESSQDLSASQSSAFSMLEAADEQEMQQAGSEQVQRLFSLAANDRLLVQFGATLYRLLPVNGALYVTSHNLCFFASSLATKAIGRTKMILPYSEIISCVKHTAFQFGQHGLVLTIRGHEELFLEFPSRERRDQCVKHVEEQVEQHRDNLALPSSEAVLKARADAVVLTDLSRDKQGDNHVEQSSSSASDDSMSLSASQQLQDMSLMSLRPKRSLHFTILTIGSRGDVQPFLALAKGLVAEGHKVRLATHSEFGPWIQQHGVEFREIGGDPAELMRICVENGTFTLSFFREGVTKFRGWLEDLLVSCWDACQGTDVIIENPNALAGIHIAEALELPYFRAFTMPWSRTRAYPQAFAVPNKKAGGNYNYLTYVIFDKVMWTASSFQINRWRRSCLGLQSTSLDRLEQHKIPFLYNFSPNLVPKPLDWSDWIHVTGFWFLDNPEPSIGKSWSPSEELVSFIKQAKNRGKKLIYVGWGSITVPDAAGTTRCVVDAVRKSGVCAILSKGWSDRLSKGKSSLTKPPSTVSGIEETSTAFQSSPDIFQIDSAPHDWLFPQMDAACHHGGAGTLGASLRAGIPTIIKPYFGDQFFYGSQVESLGVGSCVKNLTVDNLSAAITKATTDKKQIERAQSLGSQIRAENGVENAIRAIYADLDYASSLIKRNTKLSATTLMAKSGRVTTTRTNLNRSRSQSGSRSRNRSRAGSVNTTSDEWSVVSGDEE